MSMEELARLIISLRENGWTDTKILNLLLWTATGEEKYKN